MILAKTKRPGNLDVTRAAAILCGDWGTSAEYAKGLAFAIAGYISFRLIAAMCLSTVLVGANYIRNISNILPNEIDLDAQGTGIGNP
jgi:hypothetical protein